MKNQNKTAGKTAQINCKELAGQKILLIQGISRVMHTPYIIEGEFSSTGKTIKVTTKNGNQTCKLKTKEFLKRQFSSRNATTFQPYTKEQYKSSMRANYDPANQRGGKVNKELPEQNKKVLEVMEALK